jgi:4-amino-4-deoxy-L-arabinose transferase-like glycosyltransferase
VAVLAIALAVRLIHLTYHSFWFDEAVSAFWAAQSPGRIWQAGLGLVEDKHPPLYYLLLHAWSSVLGDSDAALRAMGVLIGALAVLPTYAIGRRLGGPLVGLLGALLLALNPFLIWYSQEVRMFMPATTFMLTGLLGVLTLWDRPWRRLTAIWSVLAIVLGFVAGLYSYLFSAFLLPVAWAWLLVLGWINRRRPHGIRRLAIGVATLVGVALLFLPLARSAWLVSGQESVPGRAFAGMADALWGMTKAYLLGWPALAPPVQAALVIGLGGLALLGLLAALTPGDKTLRWTRGPEQRSRLGGGLLALWLLIPLLAGGLLLARDSLVFGETRYFIFLVPALCLAMGRGLAWIWKRRQPAGLVGLAAVLVVLLVALPGLWRPENRREAWREAAQALVAQARSGEAVLVYIDYVHPALNRYLADALPLFYPLTDALASPEQLDEPLEGLVQAGFSGIWVVQSRHQDLDPDNLLLGWFGARYPLISEQFPQGIAIHGFATDYRLSQVPANVPTLPNAPTFGNLRLLACDYDAGPVAARDDLYHPPSGWVHVTTFWTADGPVREDFLPSVRLVDEGGQIWGDKLERSNDAIHLWPTSRWTPGEVVRVDYDVNLNPATPPGEYRLVIGVSGLGSDVVCGSVAVE